MNDVLPNAIKRTIANFRNEYIIQHGVNTEDEQPESEVSKAIAKLADLLHGTRKAVIVSFACKKHSCF